MLGLTFNVEDGRITIFRSTLEALGWPTHYRFLYNREAKQVAVQNCTAEDAGAHQDTEADCERTDCEIKCVALVRMIYRDMRSEPEQDPTIVWRGKRPQTATCEFRSGHSVFGGKRESSGRKSKPHKAPVWRRIVRCGKFLGLAN